MPSAYRRLRRPEGCSGSCKLAARGRLDPPGGEDDAEDQRERDQERRPQLDPAGREPDRGGADDRPRVRDQQDA